MPKHAGAEIADPHRDHERCKGLLFDEEVDCLGRARALRSRLLTQVVHSLFNLVGGVLNCVRRSTFRMLDQVATSRFNATRSSRNSAISKSAIIDVLIVGPLASSRTVRPRRW